MLRHLQIPILNFYFSTPVKLGDLQADDSHLSMQVSIAVLLQVACYNESYQRGLGFRVTGDSVH